MENKVTVKVFLRSPKNKQGAPCRPFEIIGTLLRKGKLKLVVQGMISELEYTDREENNRNICVAFMVSLIKNGLSNGWTWVKGKSGNNIHNWLECDGFAVDASMMPGITLKDEPNSILVMDENRYRKSLGLKVIQRRNQKQIQKWLTKYKPIQKNVVQDPNKNPSYATLNIIPRQVAPGSASMNKQEMTTVQESSDKKAAEAANVPCSDGCNEDMAVKFELKPADVEDKKAYKEKLAAQILKFKNSGFSNIKIATMLLKKGFPTRSGRGSWNPRMVNDVYKSVANG